MPKGVPIDRTTAGRFWHVYNKTGNVAEAIRRTGVGRTWAYQQVRGLEGGSTDAKERRKVDQRKPPPRLDELSDVALDCLKDFGRFRARYLGSVSVPWQEECAHRIVDLLDSPEDAYAVVNCPQGGGKTRFFSHDLPAWITARDRSVRGILGSLGLSLSKALVGNLRDTLGRSVPVQPRPEWVRQGIALNAEAALVDDYGRFQPMRDEGGSWSADKLTVVQWPDDNGEVHPSSEKEPTWAGFSYEARFLGWRVDFMVWDDLVNTQMLRNPDQVEALYRWWDDEAESRLDPGGLCLLVGQRLRSNDIYRYALDKASIAEEIDVEGLPEDVEAPKQYHHFVYKAHYDELCEGGTHTKAMPPTTFDRETGKPDGGSCLLDAKRITPAKIKAKKNAGNFEVVFQQEDSDPASVLVQREWVNGGVGKDGVDYPGCYDRDRRLGELPRVPPGSWTVRYMTVDPSPTRFWYLFDILYVLPADVKEPLAGWRYVIQAKRAKMGANDLLDWSRNQGDIYIGLAEEWVQYAKGQGVPIEFFIMEKNAAQRWAMQYEFFNNWKMSRGVNVLPHETMRNKTDPDLGVEATLPNVFQHGRVRLPSGDPESKFAVLPFVQEVTNYPNGSTTDGVMSFWFGEYNLQHLVARRNTGSRVHRDIPSWMRER